MLTIAAAAAELGVGTRKLRSWFASGELVAVNLATSKNGRRYIRIDRNDLERFLSSRHIQRDTQPAQPASRYAGKRYDWGI